MDLEIKCDGCGKTSKQVKFTLRSLKCIRCVNKLAKIRREERKEQEEEEKELLLSKIRELEEGLEKKLSSKDYFITRLEELVDELKEKNGDLEHDLDKSRMGPDKSKADNDRDFIKKIQRDYYCVSKKIHYSTSMDKTIPKIIDIRKMMDFSPEEIDFCELKLCGMYSKIRNRAGPGTPVEAKEYDKYCSDLFIEADLLIKKVDGIFENIRARIQASEPSRNILSLSKEEILQIKEKEISEIKEKSEKQLKEYSESKEKEISEIKELSEKRSKEHLESEEKEILEIKEKSEKQLKEHLECKEKEILEIKEHSEKQSKEISESKEKLILSQERNRSLFIENDKLSRALAKLTVSVSESLPDTKSTKKDVTYTDVVMK